MLRINANIVASGPLRGASGPYAGVDFVTRKWRGLMSTLTNNTIVPNIKIEKCEAIRQLLVLYVAKLFTKSICPNMSKVNTILVQRRIQKHECVQSRVRYFLSAEVSVKVCTLSMKTLGNLLKHIHMCPNTSQCRLNVANA